MDSDRAGLCDGCIYQDGCHANFLPNSGGACPLTAAELAAMRQEAALQEADDAQPVDRFIAQLSVRCRLCNNRKIIRLATMVGGLCANLDHAGAAQICYCGRPFEVRDIYAIGLVREPTTP
jgi:hypothetical protein